MGSAAVIVQGNVKGSILRLCIFLIEKDKQNLGTSRPGGDCSGAFGFEQPVRASECPAPALPSIFPLGKAFQTRTNATSSPQMGFDCLIDRIPNQKGNAKGNFPGMPNHPIERDFVSATFGYQVPLLLAGPLTTHKEVNLTGLDPTARVPCGTCVSYRPGSSI